tara:strand:- start:448 stop:597 length:150 start_codon:yes stop_codon:yes gene_type:complete
VVVLVELVMDLLTLVDLVDLVAEALVRHHLIQTVVEQEQEVLGTQVELT